MHVLAIILAAEGAPNPILPAVNELIWGTLSFLVLFAFLYKKVFPRINEALDGRAERIRRDLERAEEARNEAQRLLDDYREQLRGAREESRRIVDEARQAAEAMRRDIVDKAEGEARQILQRAEQDIASQRNQAFNQLRREVGVLAVEVADRIVRNSLDRDRQLGLVDDYIQELERARS